MEALLLQDGAYVNDRYEALRQLDQLRPTESEDACTSTGVTAECISTAEALDEECHELDHWRIVQRAKALEAKGPTPQLKKKFYVLDQILGRLYAPNDGDLTITSASNGAPKRSETSDSHSPVPFKELPLPTQVVLRMFFRACQSLRDPTKQAANSRLSVQVASKLPSILTTMPSCVLSPGLVEDIPVEVEDGGNVSSVFYQLFQLFEELLGLRNDGLGESSCSTTMGQSDRVCLSTNDRATVVVAYVALGLKWGRLGYLMKGVKLLLEHANEISGTRFEPLLLLLRELAATSIERSQVAFGEEEQPCGYLMSFGKGDHGKLGHGQCAHVSCQEGNCTENKMVPTMIAATRDVLFQNIDSLSTHSIGITAKGDAMAWGNGDKYRLGHGSSTKEYTPRTIEFLSLKGRVRDLACGLGHTLALMESGELFAWGNGSNGRLGLRDTNDRSSPTKVVIPINSQGKEAEEGVGGASDTLPIRFRHIFCGASHSLGISWDGKAYAWGKNNQGQCGHGHTNDQLVIQEIESFCDNEEGEEEECVVYAAGGWEHTLFCTASGRVYSCGCGYKDSRRAGIPPVLGHGDCDRRLKPTLVLALEDTREEFVKVACGWDHSLAVSGSGRVYTWGSGTNSKLGHGDEESFDIPTLVRSMEGKRVKDAKAGCEHTVFLTYDHELWTCGQGDSGRLGHGDSQTRKRPTRIEVFAECGVKPVALAVGDKYNLVLVKDDDAQTGENSESGVDSIQKRAYRVGDEGWKQRSGHGASNVHYGRHRPVQHKKHYDSQQMQFGANWVLSVAAGLDPRGNTATRTDKEGSVPDSANGVALFIAGHMDRLAADYITDESEPQTEKRQEPKGMESRPKAQLLLLPFAADTSCGSLNALLQLLRWLTSPESVKDKVMQAEKDGPGVMNGLCLTTEERMGLVLSCLRILQLNLKKVLDTPHASAQIIEGGEQSMSKLSKLSIELFSRIHALLDSLAGRKEEDILYQFDSGAHRSGGTKSLCAVGSAISQEAACALKMGFCMFYPAGHSRCSLLWEILDDCKVNIPSMRTVILSEQLCQDSIMTEIFTCLPSNGLLNLTAEIPTGMDNEGVTGNDIFEVKSLMIVLLKRSSAEAIKHLDNEAFTDFTSEPDCFLRLLHVLQTHYFSIVYQYAFRRYHRNEKGNSTDPGSVPSNACRQMMDALLEYVDALMAEALTVLKRLHTGSRQHEEIITWRLNGSFFHTLMPSAIECLSVLLLPVPDREGTSKDVVERTAENLLLVERVLPNLHVMLKMLDEVSWKMHSAGDAGNQTHDDNTPTATHYLWSSYQERNWFVDLGDACAVLCGKLSCELFYPSKIYNVETQDATEHERYYSVVLSEGRLLQEEKDVLPTAKAQISCPTRTILEWERLGVFEVEDELVGYEEESSVSGATGSVLSSVFDNQRFLLQFSEADFSGKPLSFWSWIAASLSRVVDFTTAIERLLSLVAVVSSWHLGLTEELRHSYELYEVDTTCRTSLPTGHFSTVPTGRIWNMFSTLLSIAKKAPWIKNSVDSNAVENAISVSRLLLSLRPNPTLVPPILRLETEGLHSAGDDDSLTDFFGFLTTSVDAGNIQQALVMKEVDAALVRTGVCILHDLLRKLTTSSAKSCLLDEFISVTCATSRMSSTPIASRRRITLNQENDKRIGKAIENLFVRLARIISSDDTSYELKKKALLAWTVPLGTTKRSVPSVAALIAKSGIVSTLVELLLEEANILDTHDDINPVIQPTIAENHIRSVVGGDKWGSLPPGFDPRLSTKVAPVKAFLFDQTPAQIISMLAWEAFSSISLQLSRSEHFAQHRPILFIRSAGSSLHEREPLTPRNASMSPRRRLTLPKKMVIATIGENIEQTVDGLFFMLKGIKGRFDALNASYQEYGTLLRPVEKPRKSSERQHHNSQVLLLGRPVQISQSSTHDIRIPKSNQPGKTYDSMALSFWIYVEHTGASGLKHLTEVSTADNVSSTNPRLKESPVCLLAFSTDQDTSTATEANGTAKGASLIVFTRDSHPDHVSMGLSMRCTGTTTENWCSILVDVHLPRGKWTHVALNFDKDGSEHFQIFVGGRHSTLNNCQPSDDSCKLFCSEYLQKAGAWTLMTAGGNVDLDVLTTIQGEDTGNSATDLQRLSTHPKRANHYGFAAILDDIIITHETLPVEMVPRMQNNGTILFRLKQQHVAESHCAKVLRLLCQFVGQDDQSSGEASLARLSISDRWIALFTRMLLSTCRDQHLTQVYLCHLLRNVLPRAPPPPEFDVQALCHSLFSTRAGQMQNTTAAELFDEFNDQSHLPSTSSIQRQNEALYRAMQQHGILRCKPGDERLPNSNNPTDGTISDVLAMKTKLSMRFAAGVHLIQKLCSSPSWRSCMDEFIGSSSAIFQNAGELNEVLQSEEDSTLHVNLAATCAVVNTAAGYSEEALNVHRVSVQDASIFPSPIQTCNAPFDSVIHLDESSTNQATHIQGLIAAMVKEGTQDALCLPARKDILSKFHNDVVTTGAVDLQIGSVLHLYARALRVLMVALLREQRSATTTKTWHHFILENTATCDDMLRVASSYTKEYVTTALGPDAKIAMKLRRLRIFIKGVLHGSKHPQGVPLTVSLAELEILQWRIWEEMTARHSSIVLIPWWQQSSENNGNLTLEVVGGEVELCDLKAKALEHFPTVRLAQANISANSGLWFFEVVVLSDGLMQIGYVDRDFTADPLQGQGVGDHTNSWAFDGFRCKKWNVNSYDYGEQWRTEDVVGVLLDTDRMEISYFLNGKFLGVAFSGIPITASSRMCPAASLNVHQSAEFYFGTPSVESSSEEGLQSMSFGGFKHLPVLDDEDQARLRPIISALQTHSTSKTDGIGSKDKEDTQVNDASEDWSSSSGSETDDGEIALEGTETLSGFRRTLESISRDGLETQTTDQNDEENGHRRRNLVEGLTGLGFPLEWATRCATETRLPMDETGAVAWILEQMEKAGQDRPPSLPSSSTTNGDGMEHSGQPTALWSTRMQLPNLVVSHSADDLATESSSTARTGAFNLLERLGGSNISLASEIRDNQNPTVATFHAPGSSVLDKQSSTSAMINGFIEGDKDDQQSDDAAHEAFQSRLYRQRQIDQQVELQLFNELETSTTDTQGVDRKRSVDDILPLSVAIDTTLVVAYARQALTSLLLLGLRTEEQSSVYRTVRRLVLNDESSSRFYRVLRLAIGLDTMDVAFEMGFITDSSASERSLKQQQAIAALLQFEAGDLSSENDSTEIPSERRSPLLDSLCHEMLSQCDRGLSLVRSKQTSKNMAEPTAVQLAAAWFGWVSGLVIGFVESQLSELSSVNTAGRLSALAVPPFSSTSFVENLVTIASSPSSTSMAWKYVAFRLISRILLVFRANGEASSALFPLSNNAESQQPSGTSSNASSAFFAAAQLTNVTELFTLRCRREMYNRVFFSDVTSTLFSLLVRSSAPVSRVSKLNKRQNPDNQPVSLHVNNYSSTHVTISWDQASRSVLPAIPSTDSDAIADADTTTETKAAFDSTIMFLEVKRSGLQLPDGSSTNSSKALPSKGSFTVRNLLPDTEYLLRLGPAQPLNENLSDTVNDADRLQDPSENGAELIFQTPPETVFELDRDTMGKNLVAFNRNLTAKNTVNKKWHSMRASVAFDEGVHRWQVRLDTCVSKNIFIGVCTAEASMENYVGSDAYGYGFLANKAVWHNKAKLHSYGEIFKQGDTIQVTLDCNAKTLAFSRNGEYLGIAASNMRVGTSHSGVGSDRNCKWYPAFSMYNKDDKVTLIPPSAASIFSSKEGRPQNAWTFELIEAMQDVLTYQSHLTNENFNKELASTQLFEKSFEAFGGWKRGEKMFREIALGQVIAVDQSKFATEKYGLATGDSVFTSKGQCTVLGEYRHELWYEVDEGGSPSLFDTSSSQLASWSLSACREMLASPDEYPVHRNHKYKFELESDANAETQAVDSAVEQQDTTEQKALSFQSFIDSQQQWVDNGINAQEADAKLIAELDAIASSQTSSSPTSLSFADVSTALLLEKLYEVHEISAEFGSNQTIERIGVLLYVNRCLYHVVRLAMPRNIFATSLVTCGSPESPSNQASSSKQAPAPATECHQVSPVAALLNSPHWTLDDPTTFTQISALAAQLLFSSQKEKLIDEELRRTKTASRAPSENEDSGMETDLPTIKISYPLSRAGPFWEFSGGLQKKKQRFRLPLYTETVEFVQLAKQLAAQDARQWRRESSQPFEAIPISQAFQVQVEKPSSGGDASKDVDLEKNSQQQQDEDEEDQQLQQPSSKQTAQYLHLFESVVREIQSPRFPLFTPVDISLARVGVCENEPRQALQLDVNLELYSPSALAQSRVRSSQLLLWYFCFGQVLGIAWRSKLLLPLQFLSRSFWNELVSPAAPVADEHELERESGSRSKVREAVICAVRDGLLSIVPSQCVALLSGDNSSLRERLSDLDVNYVARLERHATYSVPRQCHHELFWKAVNAFTSVERRMLEQFVSPERRNDTKQVEVIPKADNSSSFVLEIADALADGQDHPDSCYPVVVPIGPHSSRLHLPAYSSAQTLRHKLLLAMTNIPFM